MQNTPMQFGAMDPIAGALMSGGLTVNSLRTNANLLQKDEWKQLDSEVVGVARKRLAGVADLQAAGLTYPVGGLGVLTAEWENTSAMSEANQDMSGVAPGDEDSVEFETQGVPIPITHKGYRINFRRLEASRRNGTAIDVTQAGEASRVVTLKLEDMLFNGSNIKSDGYTIYGYTTFPYRTRTNIGTAWDAASPDIVGDAIHMVTKAAENSFYGPFTLYVPTNYWAVLNEDYDTYKNGTWLERLLRIPEIANVRVTSALASTEVVMVQLSRDVVDLAVGSDIVNVPWQSMGGLQQHMKVMAAMAPRIKSTQDEDGNTVCGIVHAFESATSTTTTA